MPSHLRGHPRLSCICPSMSQSLSCVFILHYGSTGFFTCFHFTGFAYLFFPAVFWLLVEMLDSQTVPGDLSSGSWPDSPRGISKMQLNFCSLIRPTSPVWDLALHGLELPKALCSLSPVHPDWLAGQLFSAFWAYLLAFWWHLLKQHF